MLLTNSYMNMYQINTEGMCVSLTGVTATTSITIIKWALVMDRTGLDRCVCGPGLSDIGMWLVVGIVTGM
jgi:hypothetical protein